MENRLNSKRSSLSGSQTVMSLFWKGRFFDTLRAAAAEERRRNESESLVFPLSLAGLLAQVTRHLT
jgi:hypothetical protein